MEAGRQDAGRDDTVKMVAFSLSKMTYIEYIQNK
jgi:hypothetical protein